MTGLLNLGKIVVNRPFFLHDSRCTPKAMGLFIRGAVLLFAKPVFKGTSWSSQIEEPKQKQWLGHPSIVPRVLIGLRERMWCLKSRSGRVRCWAPHVPNSETSFSALPWGASTRQHGSTWRTPKWSWYSSRKCKGRAPGSRIATPAMLTAYVHNPIHQILMKATAWVGGHPHLQYRYSIEPHSHEWICTSQTKTLFKVIFWAQRSFTVPFRIHIANFNRTATQDREGEGGLLARATPSP